MKSLKKITALVLVLALGFAAPLQVAANVAPYQLHRNTILGEVHSALHPAIADFYQNNVRTLLVRHDIRPTEAQTIEVVGYIRAAGAIADELIENRDRDNLSTAEVFGRVGQILGLIDSAAGVFGCVPHPSVFSAIMANWLRGDLVAIPLEIKCFGQPQEPPPPPCPCGCQDEDKPGDCTCGEDCDCDCNKGVEPPPGCECALPPGDCECEKEDPPGRPCDCDEEGPPGEPGPPCPCDEEDPPAPPPGSSTGNQDPPVVDPPVVDPPVVDPPCEEDPPVAPSTSTPAPPEAPSTGGQAPPQAPSTGGQAPPQAPSTGTPAPSTPAPSAPAPSTPGTTPPIRDTGLNASTGIVAMLALTGLAGGVGLIAKKKD